MNGAGARSKMPMITKIAPIIMTTRVLPCNKIQNKIRFGKGMSKRNHSEMGSSFKYHKNNNNNNNNQPSSPFTK